MQINPLPQSADNAAIAAAQLVTDAGVLTTNKAKVLLGEVLLAGADAGTLKGTIDVAGVVHATGLIHGSTVYSASGVLTAGGTYYQLITTNAAPTATVTSKAAASYAVVSVTAATNTFVVTGDATAEIVGGMGVRLVGSDLSDGLFTVSNSPGPVYAAPNTTFLTVEAPAGDETTGTVNRTWDFNSGDSWVGASVPIAGDTAAIPSTSDVTVIGDDIDAGIAIVVQSGGLVEVRGASAVSHGCILIESGGEAKVVNSGDNHGTIIVKSGGLATGIGAVNAGNIVAESGGVVAFSGSNFGNIVAESGGAVTLTSGNNGNIIAESGGTVTMSGAINNDANIIAESGASVVFAGGADNNLGCVIKYLNATVTGATKGIVSLGTERRTVHCATPV